VRPCSAASELSDVRHHLSFLLTTPGIWQEDHGAPKLSMVGQFLIKDGVFLGAALQATAESLRADRAGR